MLNFFRLKLSTRWKPAAVIRLRSCSIIPQATLRIFVGERLEEVMLAFTALLAIRTFTIYLEQWIDLLRLQWLLFTANGFIE